MIKVENAVLDGQRYARISDGIQVNISATEEDVDTLLPLLAAWKKGVAIVDESFLRRVAASMEHLPATKSSCILACLKCETEKLLNTIRTTAVTGDTYKFGDKALKVVAYNGHRPEDLVFFEDHTHAKQKHLNPSMRV